ncbi:MAG: DNA primase [Chloroflexota bacterium]
MSVIDEVKQKTDIIEVIGQYTTLTKAGRTFRGLCPFHSEKHGSFFVYPEQQSWHCFGACSTGGDVFSFLMKKEGMGFGEALRLLAEKAGVTIPEKAGRHEDKEELAEMYRSNDAAAQYFHHLLLNSPATEKARQYLAGRKVSPETISNFQLGFSPDSWEALKKYLLERGHNEAVILASGLLLRSDDGQTHDRFRGRLMFPIHDARGRTTGFGARALDDAMPKYLNSPQTPTFDKSGTIYAIDLATPAIRQQDMAVIVEGYMDVITAHQNGINNVVASMGTAITEKQVNILKRLSRHLVLALDADTAGKEAMLRGVNYEEVLGNEIKVAILPPDKDPDDVIKENPDIWRQLVAKAVPILDYVFSAASSGADPSLVSGKVLLVKELLPIVAGIKDTTRQTHYLKKLSLASGTDILKLETALAELRSAQNRHRYNQGRSETITHALHPIATDPLEEYCLALLLQHPELKGSREDLSPEYFESSENREIFNAWQQSANLAELKQKLDSAVHENLDSLTGKTLSATIIEERYADCALRLRIRYLKRLEARRAEVFALDVDSEGESGALTRLEEQGIEPSIRLREVFSQKKGRK